MKKKLYFLCLLSLLYSLSFAKNKDITPSKNVILMIPDGCSLPVYSAARWYQIYNQLGGDRLAVDPYICGLVKTYNSNSPVGDSAPTTSTYMTGYLSQAGNVGSYPATSEHDIHAVDSTKSYRPLMTALEAARLNQNKAVGVVVTVEFCHATPADCTAHYYNRSRYDYLIPQQVFNQLDVVIAGGAKYLKDDYVNELNKRGTKVLKNDIESFRSYDGDSSIWALFGSTNLPYDMDRDDSVIPSLAEMTEKAITRLSKNPNGFFLMVEGSQIDYAAHANDAVAMITEYLAFDKAVSKAIEFAKEDGNTTVIIVSDHGNSGFSIADRNARDYARMSLDDYFKNVSEIKASARKIEELLKESDEAEEYLEIFKDNTGITLKKDELERIMGAKGHEESDYMKKSITLNLSSEIVKILNSYNYFGFTTGGHTGEDVVLAVYNPKGEIPTGLLTNIELNKYICEVIGLNESLDQLTEKHFANHKDVFDGLKYTITKDDEKFPVLTVMKGKKKLTIPAFGATAYLGKKEIPLNTPVIYIDKTDTFYLPLELKDIL